MMNLTNRKKILLVSTNRYRFPPVIPLAVEHLCSVLSPRYDTSMLDLCFTDNPEGDLTSSVLSFNPDVICMSIRNIDSALNLNNHFFLPSVRGLIASVRPMSSAPVIIGGASMQGGAKEILDFVSADAAVAGPGEEILPELIEQGSALRGSGRVFRGRLTRSFCPDRVRVIPYRPYIENGGIPGFQTHTGCTSGCIYCIEAGTPVSFRDIGDILCELRQLAEAGYTHLHLCDAEFNEELEFCLSLLDSLRREKLGLRWTVYMKPGNYSKKLFALFEETGVYLITLSVDTFRKCPEYWEDVERIIFLAKRFGIRVCVDFLSGFPGEPGDAVTEAFDIFRRVRPDEVIVNVSIRLYKGTAVTAMVCSDASQHGYLDRPLVPGESFLDPVFFRRIPDEAVSAMIGGDPMFRIAGNECCVNYQKAGEVRS